EGGLIMATEKVKCRPVSRRPSADMPAKMDQNSVGFMEPMPSSAKNQVPARDNQRMNISIKNPSSSRTVLKTRFEGTAARKMTSCTVAATMSRSRKRINRMVGTSMPRSRYEKVMKGAQALKISSAMSMPARYLPQIMDRGRSVVTNSRST